MKKKVLVVVDYQKDFVSGSLGFEEARELDVRIAEKVKNYKEELIIFTLDTHFEESYLETREGKNLPVLHCLHQTEGWQLYGKVGEAARQLKSGCNIIEKNNFGTMNFEILKKYDLESIELVGVVTNICVITNAVILQTLYPEVPIKIDAACCGSFDQSLHEKALDVMEGLQMKVINRK